MSKIIKKIQPNGVVIDAAIPPAIDPHIAPCHGATLWPCFSLQ
jgi:hypothetical protein